jgi:hypothetical protein
MSFPLKELARLLTLDGSALGAVVAVDGNTVRVATERGAVTARTVDRLVVGDRVLIRSGMATRAPVPTHVFPV